MTKKYVIGFSILIATITLLVISNFRQSMQYYLTVDEMQGALAKIQGQEFRLSGHVVPGSIVIDNQAQPVYHFVIANAGQQVKVSYRGLAPDTFKDNSDVVVRGRYDAREQRFYANHLLAKCASKYEAKLERRRPT